MQLPAGRAQGGAGAALPGAGRAGLLAAAGDGASTRLSRDRRRRPATGSRWPATSSTTPTSSSPTTSWPTTRRRSTSGSAQPAGAADRAGPLPRSGWRQAEPFDAAALERLLQEFVEAEGIKIGQIIHALRVAVTGKAVGFGMFETLAILGARALPRRASTGAGTGLSIRRFRRDGRGPARIEGGTRWEHRTRIGAARTARVTSRTGADEPNESRAPQLHRGDHRRGPSRAGKLRRPRAHALPARAQRLPAHRPRQVDLPQLRHRRGVRRPVQPALRRHQPDQGGGGVRRVDQRGRPLARLRLGRPAVLRLGLLRAALRVGRAADPQGQGLRLRPDRRRDPRVPRHADRARPGQPVPRPLASRRTSTCSGACARASSPTAPACCARRSTWPPAT